MLRRLLLQICGLLVSAFPLSLLVVKGLKKWGRVFSVKERSAPPATLTDPQWGRHGYITVSRGIKLHYVEKGDRSKPLMLFIHGFPEFWFSWRYQLRHFSRRDYWCVAVDNRGYNDSDKPAGVLSYTIENLVADVKDVIEGLGRSKCDVLVGHDWGGAIGYAFSGRHPDLVSHYVVCNLPHPSSIRQEQMNSWKQRLMSWYMLFFQCPLLPEIFFRSDDLAMFDGIMHEMKLASEDSTEIVEAYKYAFRDPASATATINYYRAALQYPPPPELLDKKIKVPVLSIFGTGDRYLSVEAAQGTRRYVERLTEEYLDGVGHWVQQEVPDKVNAIIEDYLVSEINM